MSARYNPCMRLPRRRTLWLSAALLLAVAVVVVWLLVPRSRITQANFDRISDEMTVEEVSAILGSSEPSSYTLRSGSSYPALLWEDGPSWIFIDFDPWRRTRAASFATSWETLVWYAKKGAAKIGVRLD